MEDLLSADFHYFLFVFVWTSILLYTFHKHIHQHHKTLHRLVMRMQRYVCRIGKFWREL